ncbi:Flp pilus assembly protein CpaB [Burkholderia alba]|uniref:Flp pilus assembly protein CpaB n=1 Tax=Burkholderia alba TaxID=2683677 RepID=UPI002B054381|nr:Flp pilus assembly protein CpaB [Burkholderia alba]
MANNLTKIIAALLIGIAILLGIYAWVLGRKPAPAVPGAAPAVATRTFPLVVAARQLPAGQPITVDALKVQQAAALPPGGFADPSLVVGRIPANEIAAQAPVLATALTSGIADQIEPGERAVSIKVDETNAVGSRLRPGNYVDVFLNLKREGGFGAGSSEIAKSQARLLMSRVRVLAFGDATPDRDGTAGPTGGGVRTAVLAVPTAQVDALTLAEASGRLVLALRSPRDEDIATQTVAVRVGGDKDPSKQAADGLVLSDLSRSESSAPRPRAAAPRSGNSIEVIRGGRAETVAY